MDIFQSHHHPWLLGRGHTSVVTLDTDYLDHLVLLVSRLEAGVAHNQHASGVSKREEIAHLYTPYYIYVNIYTSSCTRFASCARSSLRSPCRCTLKN